jgi:hypothetical protein
MRALLSGMLLWLLSGQLFATTYFVSSKGSDQNAGTSRSAPWRSLGRLNDSRSIFVPGDSILLERGSVFEGTLIIQFSGQKGKEIYIGPYGSGSLPMISGATEVHNWKSQTTDIWMSEVTTTPSTLFINGQRMAMGRYPNAGYRNLQNPTKSDVSLTDSSLPFADGHWDDAEVVVKSSRWTIDKLHVKTFQNKTFVLLTQASYPIPDGYGYFIQNHIRTLDKKGEWYYDAQAHKLYLFSPGSEPTKVSISLGGPGLKASNVHDVIIDGLDIRYQNQEGAILSDAENITLANIHIAFAGTDGLHVIGCNKVSVENCIISDSGNNGVEWRNNTDGSFLKNKIIRSGLLPGNGKSGNGTYIALNISNNLPLAGRNIFQQNTIDSTGYLGIDFRAGFTRIVNNTISNFCLIKDDGAGIYTWGNETGGNVIEGNVVLHGRGSGDGTTNTTQRYAHGIYIDDRSADVTIKANTVAFCASSGIFIHNAKRLEISGNTLFGNGTSLLNREKGQLFIKRDGIVDMSNELALRIDNNSFVSIEETTPCLMLGGTSAAEVASLGVIQKNRFAAPSPQQAVSKLVKQGGMCDAPANLSLDEWQVDGFDKGSVYRAIRPGSAEPASPNLVKNGNMASTEGWIAWPDQSTLVQDRTQLLDGPSLKVAPSPGAAEVLLYHAGFSLKAGKQYRLSFIARTTKPAQVQFVPMMAGEPWKALSDYACFWTTNNAKEFVWYFTPDTSFDPVRVNFKSNVEFWIDNVILREVDPKVKPKAAVELLYNPGSKPIEVKANGFIDINGEPVNGTVSIPPFGSRVVFDNKVTSTKR